MTLQKATTITAWVLTIVLGGLFAFSAFLKISGNEMALEQARSIGITAGTYQLIGLIELIALILFVLPRTGILGALLLIAYMGGAIATHLEHQQTVVMAIAVQVLVWITAALRFPELRRRLFLIPEQKQV